MQIYIANITLKFFQLNIFKQTFAPHFYFLITEFNFSSRNHPDPHNFYTDEFSLSKLLKKNQKHFFK